MKKEKSFMQKIGFSSLIFAMLLLVPLFADAKAVRVYDVGDYVQEGLVGHFDAIRNAGVNMAHDSSTMKWKNLVGKYPDATITDGAGTWDDNGKGFMFNGSASKQAQLDDNLVLGGAITIQLATSIDTSIPSTGKYYGFFHDASKDNIAIFAYKNEGKKVCFKNDYNSGKTFNTDGKGRPEMLEWGGKYITAIINKSAMSYSLSSGTSEEWVHIGTSAKDWPGYRFSWGGSPYTENYSFKGSYHNVRIYTRVLSDNELAWNRVIDEQRYREANPPSIDDVNVVLCSNMKLGDCIDGYVGNYIVSQSETFSAPSSVTIGDNEWEAAGYVLETYDFENKKWDFAMTSNETSYTYDAEALEGVKVRVTWNWRLKRGVKKYDADDYTQAGLITHFDGVRNAGIDKPHDSNATVWRNLSSESDATLTRHDNNNSGAWVDNGYDFNVADYFITKKNITISNQATVQIAADYNDSFQSKKYPNLFSVADENEDSFTVFTYKDYTPQTKSAVYFKAAKGTRKLGAPSVWDGRIVNIAYDNGAMAVTNGTSFTMAADNPDPAGSSPEIGTHAYAIGTGQNSKNNRGSRLFHGRIHTVRLYNRILSPVELQHNMEVDYARFYGTSARSTQNDLVEVRSESPGGAVKLENEGCYIVRGTDVSLSLEAPGEITLGRCVYSCKGYRLETWNSETRFWENPVVVEELSVSLAGTINQANRRVIWLYELKSALRTAKDYDILDYVQSGLVGHYDAIRNLGATVTNHATKSMFWRDSSYRVNNLLSVSNTTYTAWTVNARHFDVSLKSPMRMQESVALGSQISIQAVLSVDPSAQKLKYPTYFGASNDHGMYGKNGNLNWKTDDWFSRATMSNWSGRYINAIAISGDKVYLNEGVEFKNSKQDEVGKSSGAEWWSVGGSAYTNSALDSRLMDGDFHALRFYKRALTEEEVAHNRKVDEIRYRGNFANYANLTVVNKQPLGMEEGTYVQCNIADGIYELKGDLTLTGESQIVNGKKLNPKYSVETYIDGGWRQIMTGTSSCTITGGENPQRVTWEWKESGLVVIVQ